MNVLEVSMNGAKMAVRRHCDIRGFTSTQRLSMLRTRRHSLSATGSRQASSNTDTKEVGSKTQSEQESNKQPRVKPKKTQAQMDEELRLAMEGLAGDGGESGLELEDGKPVSMKRGVRDNMFRYI